MVYDAARMCKGRVQPKGEMLNISIKGQPLELKDWPLTLRILDGDLLVVDRSVTPAHGKVVIAVVDGGLTVKRLTKRGMHMFLTPEPNKLDQGKYSPIEVGEETDVTIWGVVTWSVHRLETTCTR